MRCLVHAAVPEAVCCGSLMPGTHVVLDGEQLLASTRQLLSQHCAFTVLPVSAESPTLGAVQKGTQCDSLPDASSSQVTQPALLLHLREAATGVGLYSASVFTRRDSSR